jgi:hypothetical protein
MKFFMRALITLWTLGNRQSEGEKRCTRKIIGAKTGKFNKIRDEQFVWLRLLNSKDVQAIYLLVTNRPSGQIFTRVASVCNFQDTFFRQRYPPRPQQWWYLAIPVGTKKKKTSGSLHENPAKLFFFVVFQLPPEYVHKRSVVSGKMFSRVDKALNWGNVMSTRYLDGN